MVIYADVLFITNLYIDFFLLVCVKKFLQLRVSNLRIVCGAMVGAIYSLTTLIPNKSQPMSVLLGIIAALCITLVSFTPCRAQTVLKTAVSFYIFSFIFAGFFMLIYHMFPTKNLAVQNGLVYFNISPATLFFFTIGAYLVIVIFRRLFSSSDSSVKYSSFFVENQGKKKKIFAKADTGNSLREPFSGLPVIVVEKEALAGLLPDSISSYLEAGMGCEKIRLVPFSTIGGSGILPAFKADLVYSGKKDSPIDCYLGVSSKKLSAGQYDAIFHPDILVHHCINNNELNR